MTPPDGSNVSSYVHRKIDLTFTLGTGTFGESGADTVTLSGLRVAANITKAGGTSMGAAQIRVYGLTESKMNQLSTLGLLVTEVRRNTVSVSAGDDVSGMSLVFEGTINDGFVDFAGAPDVAFNISAFVGLFDAIKPVPPRTYRGSADAAVIMADIAAQMGFAFENSGVSGILLSNPYFPGTAREQARRYAQAADINWLLDNRTLAIWPKGAARGDQVPLVSPETGMVGYPAYTSQGVRVTTLYNPALAHGGKVEVRSSLKAACGMWVIQTLDYNLESETPGGAWFSSFEAARPGVAVVT